ncbi:MAG: PAS domain-containing protein [Pseudomonadota bacterium]
MLPALTRSPAAEMEFDYAETGADACIAKGHFGSIVEHVLSAVNESGSLPKDGKPRSIVGLNEVYSRQMTRELLSRNRHLEAILEGIPVGIMEVYSGKIVYVNAAAVALCGVRQEELLATYFVDLFDPVDQQRMKALLWLGSENSGDTCPGPVTIKERQLMITTFSSQGRASSSIIMISDLTHQNRLELQRRYTRNMGAVSSMAGRISKAFRQQLQEIQQVASGLLDEMAAEHPYLERLREIKRITRKMDDIIHQLSLVRISFKIREALDSW